MKIFKAALLISLCFLANHMRALPGHPSDRLLAQILVGGWGCADLKPQNERFVRDMAYEMGLKNPEAIYIKRLSQHVIRDGVYERSEMPVQIPGVTAFVTGPTFNDYTAMAVHCFGFVRSIFIDEKVFETLSLDEKRFVVGRELMRIKQDHLIKRAATATAVAMTVVGAPLLPFAAPYIDRSYDMSADLEAAKQLKVFNAAIAYYRGMSKYKKECSDDLRPWKLAKLKRKIGKLLGCLFTTHHPFRKKRNILLHEKSIYGN